jgi:hypothetical protein
MQRAVRRRSGAASLKQSFVARRSIFVGKAMAFLNLKKTVGPKPAIVCR